MIDGDDVAEVLKGKLSTLPQYVRGVLLFGSAARGETAERSDVDLLVLHEGLGFSDPVERRRVVYKDVAELTGGLFPLTVIDMELEAFLKPKRITPLLLNIYWDAVVLLDRTGSLQGFLESVRERIKRSGLVRAKDGRAYYWMLPKPMEKVEVL